MIRQLVSHDLLIGDERVILETDEQFIVSYVRGRWPSLRELPINEWFIPNPNAPIKYMIRAAQEEQ